MSRVNLQSLSEEINGLIGFIYSYRLVSAQIIRIGTSFVQLSRSSETNQRLVMILLQRVTVPSGDPGYGRQTVHVEEFLGEEGEVGGSGHVPHQC